MLSLSQLVIVKSTNSVSNTQRRISGSINGAAESCVDTLRVAESQWTNRTLRVRHAEEEILVVGAQM